MDWAAAKKIHFATAGGARITLEGGNIIVECPGKISVLAGKKSFTGPQQTSYAMPELSPGAGFMRRYVIRRRSDAQPIAHQKYRMTLDDGRVFEGVTDAQGQTSLAQSDGMQHVRIELLFD
ncbi:hypothetical protein CLD22_24360 [Rubrivivax gelatinosus]|nr:hypothetical protein [Rubrivivax gelatinosus]